LALALHIGDTVYKRVDTIFLPDKVIKMMIYMPTTLWWR